MKGPLICLIFSGVFLLTTASTVNIDLYSLFELVVDNDEPVTFSCGSAANVTVSPFLYQNYSRSVVNGKAHLAPIGGEIQMVRFSPTVQGACVATKGHNALATFRVGPPSVRNAGFISVNGTQFMLGEKLFFPFGENMCWGDPGTPSYDDWLPKMVKQGANYIRVWLGPFDNFNVMPDRLGSINQMNAYRVDYVMNLAQQLGVKVMLTLNSFNSLRDSDPYPAWKSNPFNSANGGPCSRPADFFTNSDALVAAKSKHSYVVSRYAAYSSLFSWEYFNEVNLVETYHVKDVAEWTASMAEFTISIDPWKHPRTTSVSTPPGSAELNSLSSLSYTQTHDYGASDMAKELCEICPKQAQEYNKPHIFAEFGIPSPAFAVKIDPNGLNIRNMLFGSLLCCSGGAQTWWWDSYVDKLDLYHVYGSPGSMVEYLKGKTFPPVAASTTATYGRAWMKCDAMMDCIVWVQNTNSTWTLQGGASKSPLNQIDMQASFEMPFAASSCQAQCAGTPMGQLPMVGQILKMKVPVFRSDLLCTLNCH